AGGDRALRPRVSACPGPSLPLLLRGEPAGAGEARRRQGVRSRGLRECGAQRLLRPAGRAAPEPPRPLGAGGLHPGPLLRVSRRTGPPAEAVTRGVDAARRIDAVAGSLSRRLE